MSGQSIMMFIFVVAIAVAADKAQDVSWNAAPAVAGTSTAPDFARAARGPASTVAKKDTSFITEEKAAHKHTSKVRGPLTSAVELVGTAPAAAGDVFVLRAVVSSEEALKDVSFRWLVPAGVEVVSGSVRSTIAFVGPAQPFETQITLRQVSSENVRVHFKTRGKSGEMRFADSAQYNTLMQEALQASKAELKKSTLDHAKKEKYKVMH